MKAKFVRQVLEEYQNQAFKVGPKHSNSYIQSKSKAKADWFQMQAQGMFADDNEKKQYYKDFDLWNEARRKLPAKKHARYLSVDKDDRLIANWGDGARGGWIKK